MGKHAPTDIRRAQILSAASRCFAEKGYYGTSIDDIGAAAGLSKGAIYHHFGSKREIFVELFASWSADLLERWRGIDGGSAGLGPIARESQEALDWAEEITPLSMATLEFYAHAARDEELRRQVAEVCSSVRGHLVGLLEDAQSRGLAGGVDPAGLANAVMAMFEGLVLLKIVDREGIDLPTAWRQGMMVLMRGLGASAVVPEPAA
jgi:AcrR family transcriptional regulator